MAFDEESQSSLQYNLQSLQSEIGLSPEQEAHGYLESNNCYLESENSNRNHPYVSQALHFSPLMKNQPGNSVKECFTEQSQLEEESKESELFNRMDDNTSVSNFLCLESLQSQINEAEQRLVQYVPSVESVRRTDSSA